MFNDKKIVANWLDQSGEQLRFICPNRSNQNLKDSADLDFLILKPRPLAIFTFPNHPTATLMRRQRFLASRIALMEKFGPALPVVVIVPNSTLKELVAFADLVLSIDQLPSLDEVFKTIHLNEEVQEIFRKSAPGNVVFSSSERIATSWARSTSLLDFVAQEDRFSPNTLAHIVQGALKNIVINDRNIQALDILDCILNEFILKKCGGKIQDKRFQTIFPPKKIQRKVWLDPDEKQFLIRRLALGSDFLHLRAKELITDAWLNRASMGGDLVQVLLLGSTGHREGSMNSGRLQPPDFREKPPNLQEINKLEAAGWRVFPWDFAEEEPFFIRYLKGGDYA